MSNLEKLTIFVHRASECLTDYEAHGDGLICFSLLNGLAQRGHQIYAYADTAAIDRCSPNLHVRSGRHRSPANSLSPWEQGWRAEQWMRQLEYTQKFDLVWRLHPYGGGCAVPPRTGGTPLVVGPLFYGWPAQSNPRSRAGRPRLGVGLQSIVGPLAERGWQRTLDHAALIFCATGPHAERMQRQHPHQAVSTLPVIVEPPSQESGNRSGPGKLVALVFAGTLAAHKNPRIFCETVRLLRRAGVSATGTLVGDGPERPALEAYCTSSGLTGAICFRGKIPNREVYQRLGEANFLVSTSCGEPYGRGIAEAMSVGTPAVCHRSGGPADFICDGQDGLLVNDLTAEAYAARLQPILSQPGKWNLLSAAARRKAQGWRSEAVLDTLEAQLQQVAENSRKGRT